MLDSTYASMTVTKYSKSVNTEKKHGLPYLDGNFHKCFQ